MLRVVTIHSTNDLIEFTILISRFDSLFFLLQNDSLSARKVALTAFSWFLAVNKEALHFITLICIIQRHVENKKYHQNFSKDSKFPSDI